MSSKQGAFVAWMSWPYPGGVTHDTPGSARTPVLVIPFEGEAPPDWPVGTKVRWVTNPSDIHTVASTPFLYNGDWWFMNLHGDMLRCASHEPVPPTASVTLRVTGSPEEVASIKRDFSPGVHDAGRYPYPWNGVEVEVSDG